MCSFLLILKIFLEVLIKKYLSKKNYGKSFYNNNTIIHDNFLKIHYSEFKI